MTKEITIASILQEMQDKLKLREFEPEKFCFSELVVPTYDIEQHLSKPEVKRKTVSVTSSGQKSLFSIPEDEKWHVHRYLVIFVTGSYKVAGVIILRPSLTDYMYLDLTKNQSVSYMVDLPKDVVLYPGEDFNIVVDEYTSTGDLLVHVDVTVEKIR